MRPYPLEPVLAVRRRYFLFRVSCEVHCTQTIKRDRHSVCVRMYYERLSILLPDVNTWMRPSRRGYLVARLCIVCRLRRG